MKITVLNGSPKGELSITLQYVRFIEKHFQEHEFTIHHVAHRINGIERRDEAFREIIGDIESADAVLWSVPLYIFLVPSQYKRFIELIGERGAEGVFENKYTGVITTSIHFYDHTANEYMHAVCDDLKMKYIGFFSPDMYDLTKEDERKQLLLFAEDFLKSVQDRVPTAPSFQPLVHRDFTYTPGSAKKTVDGAHKNILLLTDSKNEKTNLGKMIRRFSDSFSRDIAVVDLHDIDIKGGCLGCCSCSFDYRCVYTGKDGFIDFYQDTVAKADILVCAGTIRDRYLSSKWKQFFDRRFFMTHTPTMTGKQVGLIISGPFSQIANLRQILTANIELENANLAGIVTDEYGDSATIDELLQNLAERLVRYAGKGYVKPSTFLGVGGRKIFRDDMWGRLRFPFLADYRYYEERGLFDFPHNDQERIEYCDQMIAAIGDPAVREQIRKMIKSQMVAPFQKIIETE